MAPRSRRNVKDAWMPDRVYRGKTSYEYHPRSGGSISLCRLPKDGIESEDVKIEVFQAYKKATSKSKYTTADLFTDFLASAEFKRKGQQTQEDYKRYSEKLTKAIGHFEPDKLTMYHCRKLMDKKGEKHQVTANRYLSFISTTFGWGMERRKCSHNPAKGVKPFPETPRDLYIEDEDYFKVYHAALNSGSPYLAYCMEISYLCRMRLGEILALSENDISDEGVFVKRSKGSLNEITTWSPRLRSAIDGARLLNAKSVVSSKRPIIKGREGGPLNKSTFKTAWGRLMRKIEGDLTERFHFHDIKAKGITDHKNNYGGHKDKKMQVVYNRKPSKIESTR